MFAAILRTTSKLRIAAMPPKLILIRHADALHNKTKDHTVHGPELSPLGLQQCVALRESLKRELSKITDCGTDHGQSHVKKSANGFNCPGLAEIKTRQVDIGSGDLAP